MCFLNTLGSLSGNQAVQHAKAGLKAIYLSGWQVAADANSAGEMYPDQSLYPYDSAPKLVEAMNNALLRADQIQHMEIKDGDQKKEKRIDYMLPIIADGEAGFGGPLNVFELTKKFIKAGAAGVHFEDQVASEKKCGHIGCRCSHRRNHVQSVELNPITRGNNLLKKARKPLH